MMHTRTLAAFPLAAALLSGSSAFAQTVDPKPSKYYLSPDMADAGILTVSDRVASLSASGPPAAGGARADKSLRFDARSGMVGFWRNAPVTGAGRRE